MPSPLRTFKRLMASRRFTASLTEPRPTPNCSQSSFSVGSYPLYAITVKDKVSNIINDRFSRCLGMRCIFGSSFKCVGNIILHVFSSYGMNVPQSTKKFKCKNGNNAQNTNWYDVTYDIF